MTTARFVDVQHPDLAPDWLKEGLDEILDLVGDDIQVTKQETGDLAIGLSFWVSHYYDDNNNYSTKADFWIRLKENPDHPTNEINERRLDAIPSVRRLERNAVKLWHKLPLSYDGEGNMIGESDFTISRNHIEFSIFNDGEDLIEMRMVAEFKDGSWQCYDEITVYTDISETLRATATTQRLAEAINLTAIGFDQGATGHQILHAEINKDNAVVMRFAPGLFQYHQSVGERDD